MEKVSENILKLRELTEKISKTDRKEDEYKILVKKLKQIVDDGKSQIHESTSSQSKINCYEKMCSMITSMLSTVKIK